MRRAFDFGFQDHPEQSNPARALKSARIGKKDRPTIDPFRIQDAETLIAALHRDWAEAQGNYDEFRFFTGLRASEQIALVVSDYDSTNAVLSVTKARVAGIDRDRTKKQAFDQAFVAATYTIQDFKADVTKVLKAQYGSAVTEGDKAIAIAASGKRQAASDKRQATSDKRQATSDKRRKADVIVAAQFRRYWKFKSTYDQNYTEGICFFNAAGTRIANYPKQHSANLTAKHQATGHWLKPMVRVLKNLRGRMVTDGLLKAGMAPSYYLEGLLYNVPNGKFSGSYENCFVNAINWIQSEAKKDDLVCANEQYYLLREGSHVCWSRADAEAFLTAAVKCWENW